MRLIDADALVDKSMNIFTWLMDRQRQGIGTTLGELHGKWFAAVKEVPTAYDLDKVVEQLEELRKECEDPLQEYDPNYFIDKAIEIVKGGGVE